MAKVQVEWLGPPVEVPSLDRIVHPGDQLEMEEAEARDRAAAGQVRIQTKVPEDVARATPRKQKEG